MKRVILAVVAAWVMMGCGQAPQSSSSALSAASTQADAIQVTLTYQYANVNPPLAGVCTGTVSGSPFRCTLTKTFSSNELEMINYTYQNCTLTQDGESFNILCAPDCQPRTMTCPNGKLAVYYVCKTPTKTATGACEWNY